MSHMSIMGTEYLAFMIMEELKKSNSEGKINIKPEEYEIIEQILIKVIGETYF